MSEDRPCPAHIRRASLPVELIKVQHIDYGSMSLKWYLRIVLNQGRYRSLSIYEDGGVYGPEDFRMVAKDCPGATDEEKFGHALRYVESLILLGEL